MSELSRQKLQLGPSHPATVGALRLGLDLEGEQVVEAQIDVGYLHRGFEKECESRGWQEALVYAERLNEQASALPSTACCLAVEALLGREAPLRAQWLRVIAAELSRIGDHLTRLSVTCRQLGSATSFTYGLRAREQVAEMLELLCGGRVTTGYLRIGGVRRDVDEEFAERIAHGLDALTRSLDDFDRIAARNRIFADRLRGTGTIGRDRLVEYAVTGPLLRAAGIPYDVRKADPYLTYPQLDFDVPVGSLGDNYDRFRVCRREIDQSVRLVRQCLEALPATAGEPVADPALGDPRETGDLIVPEGEAYRAVESGNGELGFFVASDAGPRPLKLRCRAPSFAQAAALPEMLRGDQLADVAATLGLLNHIGGECDR